VFVYASGNATTLPEKYYFVNGVLTQEYSNVNAYRLPAYHRLDFAATYTPTPKKNINTPATGFLVFIIYTVDKIPILFTLTKQEVLQVAI